MTPEQACKFRMPFGKHKGISLELIVTNDPEGAGYLDWMVGQKLGPDVKEALEVFLAIHWVKDLVERATEHHKGSSGSTEPIENRKKPKNWWE